MQIARTRCELVTALARLPGRALVPTMGALHKGHLAMVAAARDAGPVVASIFVNPLQFGQEEDLTRYPRDEWGDLAALTNAGCALAFLPSVREMFPAGHVTSVTLEGPALGYEGARRPGHFRGVATVVARLIGLVQPATAWFGQKDWQQLQVIRRMVEDLALPLVIRDVETQRDSDGLALSSRNRFLTRDERTLAPALARIARQAARAIDAAHAIGQGPDAVLAQGATDLNSLGFEVDYFDVVRLDPSGLPRLIVAARLGSVRLLDNFPIIAPIALSNPRTVPQGR